MKLFKTWFLTYLLMCCTLVYAQIPPVPPNVSDLKRQPMVVLNMSKDHQLFYRAYNEYTDINFDGIPDTTYNHTIDYYGYFDYSKCYNYDGTKYVPVANATNKYCAGKWSGNFLNWSTMSRIDVVRKVLYGGYRSIDTSTQTVLERSYIPNDAHSFAKYYNGNDLPQLTPFTAAQVAPKTIAGVFSTPVGGITICNTTKGSNSGANQFSQTNTNPPLMRVAFGDFSLWNANERWQCLWDDEAAAANGNDSAITGLQAASSNPVKASVALTVSGNGPDFIVRVEACNTAWLGKENCSQYPSGNYKPTGLMHEFGAKDQAEFALITGSFAHNISGGVLRRNMNSFLSEINKDTDGTYNNEKGIVYTLNKMRVYGYNHGDGTYRGDLDNSGNWCTFQITGLNNNQCSSWGNPLGEMYLESLRYLAGKSPNSNFSAGAKDTALGLLSETWYDPYKRPQLTNVERAAVEQKFGKAQCRPMSVLNFNASAISYDLDDYSTLSSIGDGSGNITTLLDTVSEKEGISGTQRLVGRVIGGTAAQTNRLCDLKPVGSLSKVDGICPDAPAYGGSYSLAGAAYWAHTNKIRSDFTATKKGPMTVDTYSVALNPGTPIINIVAADGKKALIQPAYRLVLPSGGVGGGTLVDFRIVTQTPTYGKYLLVWEDSEQGGDYDQDVTGTLEYTVVGNQLKVSTYVFADATANPQGFGYVLSGVDKNGAHFHSGIRNFSFTDNANINTTSTNPAKLNASGGCQGCNNKDPKSTATFTIVGGTLGALPEPMLLAAKWGGFKDDENAPTKLPDTVAKWDVQKQDGSAGADGLPDNYYVVYRPDLLETALRQVFGKIADQSNSAPAVSVPVIVDGANSNKILKYQVRYSADTLSSQLQAYRRQPDGSFSTSPEFEGQSKLTAIPANLRQVITNVGASGTQFTQANITAAVGGTTYLSNLVSSTATFATGTFIDYLRGDRSNEQPSGSFRKRAVNSILGSIINSNPWVQRKPSAALFGRGYEYYGDFIKTQAARKPLLWVGAGDGMLHAFNADNLDPVISYVPEPLVPRLRKVADPAITSVYALMDGSPATADINLSVGTSTLANWKTYLFSSLGRGGKGVFALDVTDTDSLSQGSASSIFKWQFTNANDSDLGYVIADGGINPDSGQSASIVKMPNGKFAYILGNGVDSTTGKAVLFILYVQGPTINASTNSATWTTTDYKKITLDNGSGNGLMQPFWLDSNDDGVVDTIYAGDLKGNMWKVDVSSNSSDNWGVAYGGKALYTAKTPPVAGLPGQALAITGAPGIAFHPAGGVVVVFATGQSIFTSDFPNNAVTQRVYGIRDNKITPTFAIAGETVDLQQRIWTVEAVTGDLLQSNFTPINWSSKKGWYVDIPYTSGMAVHNILFAQDGTTEIGIPLIYPSAANNIGVTTEPCANNVYGAYAQVDAISGIQPSETFGTGKVGFSTSDQNIVLVRCQGCGTENGVSSTALGSDTNITSRERTYVRSRDFWREIPGIKTLIETDTNRQ
jgi:type IV pilus assembly protein PilY1